MKKRIIVGLIVAAVGAFIFTPLSNLIFTPTNKEPTEMTPKQPTPIPKEKTQDDEYDIHNKPSKTYAFELESDLPAYIDHSLNKKPAIILSLRNDDGIWKRHVAFYGGARRIMVPISQDAFEHWKMIEQKKNRVKNSLYYSQFERKWIFNEQFNIWLSE